MFPGKKGLLEMSKEAWSEATALRGEFRIEKRQLKIVSFSLQFLNMLNKVELQHTAKKCLLYTSKHLSVGLFCKERDLYLGD